MKARRTTKGLVWWRTRSDTTVLYCTVRYRLIDDQIRPWGLLSLFLPHHHERAAARDLDQQRQVKMTCVSLGWVSFAGAKASCGRGKVSSSIAQAKWYTQMCSFTACGGGVSVVSLVGSVGVCEAASQCGDGKQYLVLPIGLACLSKRSRKSVVCVRDVVEPTGKLVSVAQQQCGGDAWGGI
jgi:hypothetical protein